MRSPSRSCVRVLLGFGLLCFVPLQAMGAQWEWLAGGSIHAIAATGPGTVITAEDGGRVRIIENYGLLQSNLDTGDERNLHGISALDAERFCVVGGMGGGCGNQEPDNLVDGIVLGTADGGAVWQVLGQPNLPGERLQFEDVEFTDAQHAVLVGWQHGSSAGAPVCDLWTVNRVSSVYVTWNSGATWTVTARFLGSDGWYTALSFADQMHGWATRTLAGIGSDVQIYRTTDGGMTWSPAIDDLGTGLRDIKVQSLLHGIAVGDGGIVVRMVDGVNWAEVPCPAASKLLGVDMVGDTAIAVGEYGTLVRSSDGGATWDLVDIGMDVKLRDVSAVSASEFWVAGDKGTLLYTLDAGETWTLADQAPAPASLLAVSAAGSGCVTAVGYEGQAARTTDSGETWTPLPGLENTLKAVCFIDPLTGWVGGGTGFDNYLWHTTDGGATWVPQDPGPKSVRAFDFHSESKGWSVSSVDGATTRVRKTTDSGSTWTSLTDITTARGFDLRFLDADTGYVAGERPPEYGAKARVWKTGDGGQTWSVAHNEVDLNYMRFDEVDANNDTSVFAVGYSWMVPPERALLVRSSDGGQTWDHALSEIGWAGDALALRGQEVWVGGGAGRVFFSADGGDTWSADTTNATERIYSMSIAPEQNAIFAAGSNGLLLRCSLDPPTAAPSFDAVSLGLEVLPLSNPVLASTRLRVSGASPGECRLEVFDLRGRLLLRRSALLRVGSSTDLTWDGCDGNGRQLSGIYLLRVTDAAGYQASSKVTILR